MPCPVAMSRVRGSRVPLTPRGRQNAPTLGTSRKSSGARRLIACVVASLVLFTLSCQSGGTGPLEAVRGFFQTATMPVRYFGLAVTAPIRGLGNIFSNLTADQATLSELQEEIDALRVRNSELEEQASSAERLQELLDLRNSYDLQSVTGTIVSGASDSWSSTVTIDRGTSSGVTSGMPVMTSAGVIGQVVSSGPGSSTVMLLSDEGSSISALVQSSRSHGMLTGSANGEVKLDLVSSNQDVNVGDVVVTSGLGGVFPKGLPIGEIVSVTNNPGDLYLDIVVELYADTSFSEEVLVITSLTEEQRATAEDIAEADSQESSSSSDATGADGGTDESAE